MKDLLWLARCFQKVFDSHKGTKARRFRRGWCSGLVSPPTATRNPSRQAAKIKALFRLCVFARKSLPSRLVLAVRAHGWCPRLVSSPTAPHNPKPSLTEIRNCWFTQLSSMCFNTYNLELNSLAVYFNCSDFLMMRLAKYLYLRSLLRLLAWSCLWTRRPIGIISEQWF